jgi:hypothetical protein
MNFPHNFTEEELIEIFTQVIYAANNAKWTHEQKIEFYKRMETITNEAKPTKEEPLWETID